jgi:hypothetical protein
MNTSPEGPHEITTALSTLSARVALLERWMRRYNRLQTLLVLVIVVLLVSAALLAVR